nr:type I restriction endonuclease [Lebetimonas sp. JH292]
MKGNMKKVFDIKDRTFQYALKAIGKTVFKVCNKYRSQGYDYLYGGDIAPDGENPLRESFENVILYERLRNAIRRFNPELPQSAIDDAIKQLTEIHTPDLITNNEIFHRMLTDGY